MSLFFQRSAVTRDAFPTPQIPTNGQLALAGLGRYDQIALGRAETAMQKTAVWAAVNLLATSASSLPIDVLQGAGDIKRPAPSTGFFVDPDGSGQGLHDWLYMLMVSWLLRGNAYGLVHMRDAQGRPSQIELLHPDDVTVRVAAAKPAQSPRSPRYAPTTQQVRFMSADTPA